MKISFSSHIPEGGVLCLGIFEDSLLSAYGHVLNQRTKEKLSKALSSSRFNGKIKENFSWLSPEQTSFDRLVFMGLGKKEKLKEAHAYEIGASLTTHLLQTPHTQGFVICDELPFEMVLPIAFGALLGSWRFDKYCTKLKPHQKIALKELVFYVKDSEKAKNSFSEFDSLAKSIAWSRDLVSEPGNILYPETLAQESKKLESLGVEVEILNSAEMKKLGMNALLGVGKGSERESFLSVMQWKGSHSSDLPIVFVGKGITFDSGGISLKPSSKMDEMKGDMGGAAVVLGVMQTLASRKAAVNAVGVIALAENMVSGKAQRPGDIVTSMSGQTIEILDTDAEGRLVLADALWYAQSRFKPQHMIDLATLTGAVRVALGPEYAGIFSNDNELVNQLLAAGEEVGEKAWRLPLGEGYDKEINSLIADMKNIASSGYGAGSSIAAQFLHRFINNVSWAHLDIAAVEEKNQIGNPTAPKGSSVFGISLLNRWIKGIEGKKK